MKKRRTPDEPENPDRWVVSYADFITLLFAFFTTLFAISHVDAGKLQEFVGSMKTAFKVAGGGPVNAAVIDGILPPNYADIGLERELTAELSRFGIIEGLAISRDRRGVVVALGETLLFDSGSAELKREAQPVLAAIAALARKAGRGVRIEGHTDNMPLRNSPFPSNLVLSSVRAGRVYEALLAEGAAAPERYSVAGYGEHRPVASNAAPEGRIKNRRVEIIFASAATES